MGRKAVLLGFMILGYSLGAFAWLVKTPVLQFIENLGLDTTASQSLLAGFFGSTVMVLAVVSWSYLSSN